jgi:hypothetical protein
MPRMTTTRSRSDLHLTKLIRADDREVQQRQRVDRIYKRSAERHYLMEKYGPKPASEQIIDAKPSHRIVFPPEEEARYKTRIRSGVDKVGRALRSPAGRRIVGTIRMAGGALSRADEIASLAEPLMGKLSVNLSHRSQPTGWEKFGECKLGALQPTLLYFFWPGGHQGNNANNCLAGQANTGGATSIGQCPVNYLGASLVCAKTATSSYQHVVGYGRTLPAKAIVKTYPLQLIAPKGFRAVEPMPHPALHRVANPTRQPRPWRSPQTRAEARPFERTLTITRSVGRAPPRTPRVGAHKSSPPPPRTQERKTKLRQLAALLTKALDTVSEYAEIVDALYRALPADVQARWSKGRKDRPGDSAGQYGIDGADWKLQALYHNWKRLDTEAAVRNIIQNEIEDRLHGAVHKRKDKLLGRGKYRNRPARERFS